MSPKERWLSKYKSREGRAIARRAWDAAIEEAASQVETLFGVGAHPACPYKCNEEYASAVRALAPKEKQ